MKKAKHRDGCERGVWSRYDLLCERCRETRKIEQAWRSRRKPCAVRASTSGARSGKMEAANCRIEGGRE